MKLCSEIRRVRWHVTRIHYESHEGGPTDSIPAIDVTIKRNPIAALHPSRLSDLSNGVEPVIDVNEKI